MAMPLLPNSASSDVQADGGIPDKNLGLGGGGGRAVCPALGQTRAIAGLLQDRHAPTTAIRFEAQATAEIDDHEAAGLCRRRATNDGGYYADQNADDAEGVFHGFLLCPKTTADVGLRVPRYGN